MLDMFQEVGLNSKPDRDLVYPGLGSSLVAETADGMAGFGSRAADYCGIAADSVGHLVNILMVSIRHLALDFALRNAVGKTEVVYLLGYYTCRVLEDGHKWIEVEDYKNQDEQLADYLMEYGFVHPEVDIEVVAVVGAVNWLDPLRKLVQDRSEEDSVAEVVVDLQ